MSGDDPLSVQDLRIVVTPEAQNGERTIVLREGFKRDIKGPLVIGRSDHAEAHIDVQTEKTGEETISVQTETELFREARSPYPESIEETAGDYVHPLFLGKSWGDVAEENVDRWGLQAPATILLAMVEEMGETATELVRTSGVPMNEGPAQDGWKLLRDMADLGRRTREYLEENFETPAGKPKPESEREEIRVDILDDVEEPDEVQAELDDVMPLGFQLTWALQDERDGE